MEIAQGSVIGNYRILMPLGKGGMGAVYEVEHENPGAVAWARASMTVTASFGYDRSLVSYLYVSYGTESEPQVSCALSVQNVHFINEGDRPERVYPVSVSIICPVETNGVVDISHEGDDGALFWSDAAATQPLQSLSRISLSSVEEGSGGASYTFYITHNVGTSADWDFVCSEMVKDDAGNDVEVLNDQAKSLLNTYSAGVCIEIYYAGDIRGCSDTPDVSTRAFQSKRGILIGSKVRMRDVVHELGHALGLDDC